MTDTGFSKLVEKILRNSKKREKPGRHRGYRIRHGVVVYPCYEWWSYDLATKKWRNEGVKCQ